MNSNDEILACAERIAQLGKTRDAIDTTTTRLEALRAIAHQLETEIADRKAAMAAGTPYVPPANEEQAPALGVFSDRRPLNARQQRLQRTRAPQPPTQENPS